MAWYPSRSNQRWKPPNAYGGSVLESDSSRGRARGGAGCGVPNRKSTMARRWRLRNLRERRHAAAALLQELHHVPHACAGHRCRSATACRRRGCPTGRRRGTRRSGPGTGARPAVTGRAVGAARRNHLIEPRDLVDVGVENAVRVGRRAAPFEAAVRAGEEDRLLRGSAEESRRGSRAAQALRRQRTRRRRDVRDVVLRVELPDQRRPASPGPAASATSCSSGNLRPWRRALVNRPQRLRR